MRLINNLNMTANSVEKHCIISLNVKWQVTIKFKRFYKLLEVFLTPFAWNTTADTACFAQKICIHKQQTRNFKDQKWISKTVH